MHTDLIFVSTTASQEAAYEDMMWSKHCSRCIIFGKVHRWYLPTLKGIVFTFLNILCNSRYDWWHYKISWLLIEVKECGEAPWISFCNVLFITLKEKFWSHTVSMQDHACTGCYIQMLVNFIEILWGLIWPCIDFDWWLSEISWYPLYMWCILYNRTYSCTISSWQL